MKQKFKTRSAQLRAFERSRRNQYADQKRSEFRAMMGLGAVLMVFASIMLISLLVRSTKVESDTHCELGSSNDSERATMVLVDMTDDLSPMKRGGILNMAKAIIGTLKRNERFSLFMLRGDNTDDFQPLFSSCNPGEPSFADYISKGRRQLRAEFEKGFTDAFEQKLVRELAAKGPAKQSPIIEAIRDIAHSQYWAKTNRLYIFSDLLEHSSLATLYKKTQTFDAVLRTPASIVVNNIDLKGATIGVCPTEYRALSVDPEIQANALVFWKKFFQYTKAECVRISCQRIADRCDSTNALYWDQTQMKKAEVMPSILPVESGLAPLLRRAP